MADDDDDGFGDFKFAPSNTTVPSHPPMMNGHDISANNNDDDDDDWGDFVNHGGLFHAMSLPRFPNHLDPFRLRTDQKVEDEDSELRQPDSAPGRASGMAQWTKPTGALPLSIFGEIEEERRSGAGDPSFSDGGSSLFSSKNVDSVKKVSGPNVNDLIANLYKQNDFVPNVHMSNSDDKINKKDKNSDVNMNALDLGAVEFNSNSHVPDFSLNWVNSIPNGKNESTLDSQGLNLDWDPLKLNPNGSNSNKGFTKEVIPIANGDNLGSGDGNETFDNGEDDDDDDGWEFKDAQASKTTVDEEISKMNQIKTENGQVVNSNGINTSWSSLSSDFNGWNSNFDLVSSSTNILDTGLVKQAREHAPAAAADDDEEEEDDDGWEFKVADSKTPVEGDKVCLNKNEHMKILNSDGLSSSWDISLSNSSGLNSHVLSSDEKQFNANFIDEKKDSGVANVWAFNGAEPDLLATDENPKITAENGPASILRLDRRTSSNLNGVNLDTKQVDLNLFDKNEDFWGNDGWEFKTAGSVHGPGDENTKNHTGNILPFSKVDKKLEPVENSWSSKHAFPEAVRKDEENKVEVDNNKRALPLSIFGDEEKEEDNPVIHQDSSTLITPSNLRNAIKNHQIDINDLISSLYSEAEQNTSVNHEEILSESGLDSTRDGGSNLARDIHDFDDDSWEFQDASGGAQENGYGLVEEYSTKTEQNDYVEFFSGLREELHYTALYHLENLKKSQSAAALNGAKTQDLDEEMQNLESELQDDIISTAICSENCSPREISLNVFVEALLEPKFQVFGSEYQLVEKVSLAANNWRSAIDVLKCATLIVNILTSASREEQSSYISAWSKMVSVCAQELRHGTSIWKQARQQNFQDQILSRPQGKKYILGLGEVYRVAKVIESSAKLYKPWILLSSADSMRIFTLISECSSLWSSSGLEEALQSILSSGDFEYDGSVKTLLESIKYINDLDVQLLYHHVFSGQNPPCQLSALTAGLIPGMQTVAWNGNHCFLTLANLWANMVSSEPPNWPCIHVG
ncbi:uncharacterized protein [Euphorbia lathyris]|uniref:uncharacterized protein isoform X2 n=1 Tax=Euphorbia lathyris TaxID=212925 RepID=UPI0033132166